MNSVSDKQETSPAAATKGHKWFASFYDGMNRSEEKGFLGEWRQQLLADVAGDVLEIGAGTGANFATIRQQRTWSRSNRTRSC